MNILQPKLQDIIYRNGRLMHSSIMPYRLQKMLRIGGRSHATGAIPVVQRVAKRVLSFHHLFAC